ncbi:MAG TPA: hypothetical protein V6D08_18290, partial [Candidatus Obscuribacterales bacterium]
EFGMSERLGPMTFGKRYDHVFLGRDFGHDRDYGEHVATIIDEEVRQIITSQYEAVKALLLKHRPHMDAIVKVLLEKETLDVKEVEAIMEEVDRQLAAGAGAATPPDDSTTPTATAGAASETVLTTGSADSEAEGPPDSGPQPELKPKFA